MQSTSAVTIQGQLQNVNPSDKLNISEFSSYLVHKQQQLCQDDRPFTTDFTTNNPTQAISRSKLLLRKIRSFFVTKQKNISLLHYLSNKTNFMVNGITYKDEKIQLASDLSAEELKDSNVKKYMLSCKEISLLWAYGFFKNIKDPDDFIKQIICKNGDTPEAIKKTILAVKETVSTVYDYHDISEIMDKQLDDTDQLMNDLKKYVSEKEYDNFQISINTYKNNVKVTQIFSENELLTLERLLGNNKSQKDTNISTTYSEEYVKTKSSYDLFKKHTLDIHKTMFFQEFSKTKTYQDILQGISLKNNHQRGSLLDNSNNDYVYSFSENSFPSLLHDLCDKIKDKPNNTTEYFLYNTQCHTMSIKITKKNDILKIVFFDPNDPRQSQKLVLKSADEAYKIPIARLLDSYDTRKLYKISKDIDGYDDLHTGVLCHLTEDIKAKHPL